MKTAPETSPDQIKSIFELQKAFAPVLKQSTAADRLSKIDKIYNYLSDAVNREQLISALQFDLGKPEVEAISSEISILYSSINDIRHKLRSWLSDKKVVTPLVFMGAKSYIKYEPKGTALIISPWNYPFQLCINPLLYAIAAGCTVVLKPSEYSYRTSAFITEMISKLFDEREIAVCQGGIPTSQELLALPFDHMYFTGSSTVGKIVMQAAARHLSSVTLELGGKSPCIIDKSVNLEKAVKSIVWGKFFNTGQTCIAPDYILVPKEKKEQFLKLAKEHVQKMYDPENKGMLNSSHIGRLINEKHFDKVSSLLQEAVNKGASIVCGGDSDRSIKYISPTILIDVPLDSAIMQEEVFGPVMPIIIYESTDEMLSLIASKPKPLAFYIFSKNKKNINHILKNSTAGGTVVNDTLIHFANHNLPFGGVNHSGVGKSHGKHGFLAFSNERAIMHNKFALTSIVHPPYTDLKKKIAGLLGKWI